MDRKFDQSPPISVVIPCFNRAQLVGEAIEGALSQKANHEIIVIDDGSTDQSWKVIKSFSTRIIAKRTNNKGVSAARNLGISLARNAWVQFLDSDDRLLPEALRCRATRIANLGEKIIPVGCLSDSRREICEINLSDKGHIITQYEITSASIQVSQPLFPKEGLFHVGGFRKSSMHEDYELILRLALSGYRFKCFLEKIVFFNESSNLERLSKQIE